MHFPSVLDDGCELIQDPSGGVGDEHNLEEMAVLVVSEEHGQDVEHYQDEKLEQLDDVPKARDDEAVMVQIGRLAGIVEGHRVVLVMVWQDVYERQGGVDDLPQIDRVDYSLASGRADECFAPREDGQLESSELPLVATPRLDRPLRLAAGSLDILGRTLERIKALHEDLGEDDKTRRPKVVFVESPQDARSY